MARCVGWVFDLWKAGRMRKRSNHKVRHTNPESWRVAMQGSMLLSKADQDARTEPVNRAVAMISRGQAGKDEWQAIFDAMNMLEQFSRMPKVMRGAQDWIAGMQAVIVAILDRSKSGAKALYPTELADLRGMAELWADVLSTVTHREYFECEEKTHQRLAAILRSKTAGVRVVEVA